MSIDKEEIKNLILLRTRELAKVTLGQFSAKDYKLSERVAKRLAEVDATDEQTMAVLEATMLKLISAEACRHALIFRACKEIGQELGKLALETAGKYLLEKIK